ncbi:hypothetical protein C8R43DRAFT_952836 [Mycena crocata]|nr:hypothetical protein C8R43DRAFT_952836 [Mycena crocata]
MSNSTLATARVGVKKSQPSDAMDEDLFNSSTVSNDAPSWHFSPNNMCINHSSLPEHAQAFLVKFNILHPISPPAEDKVGSPSESGNHGQPRPVGTGESGEAVDQNSGRTSSRDVVCNGCCEGQTRNRRRSIWGVFRRRFRGQIRIRRRVPLHDGHGGGGVRWIHGSHAPFARHCVKDVTDEMELEAEGAGTARDTRGGVCGSGRASHVEKSTLEKDAGADPTQMGGTWVTEKARGVTSSLTPGSWGAVRLTTQYTGTHRIQAEGVEDMWLSWTSWLSL